MNQITPDAQLGQAAIERGLESRISFQIGYDPNQVKALTQQVPLAITPAKSPLAVVVRRMAEVIWQRVQKQLQKQS